MRTLSGRVVRSLVSTEDGDVPFFRLLFLVLAKPQSLMIHETGMICYLFPFSDSQTSRRFHSSDVVV